MAGATEDAKMWLAGAAGIARRRQIPIMAYCGANGAGKTLAAVADTLPSLEAGRPVLSTVRLLDYENPRGCDNPGCASDNHATHGAAHPFWIPFSHWEDLLEAEHCDVLMDEVTGVASARESLGLPGPIANLLVQLRWRDITLRWTAPSWARADRIIRECTQAVTMCQGFLPRQVPGRLWPSNTVFRWQTIDARSMDEITEGNLGKASVLETSWARLKALTAPIAYDTLDIVMNLPIIEGGRCTACGGRRSVPKCECNDGGAGAGGGVGPRRGYATT